MWNILTKDGIYCRYLNSICSSKEKYYKSPGNYLRNYRVYCIPCKNFKSKYIGETSRNLHGRLKEHKRDIRIGNLNNALFQHISKSNHNLHFDFAKMPIYIHDKRLRRIFEAGAISLCNSVNTRPGFYNISIQ